MRSLLLNGKRWIAGCVALACCVGFQSCLDDDDDNYYSKVLPNALVTVKPVADGVYLQLDDSTTLLPVNLSTSPFGDKEVRALTNFDKSTESSGGYDQAVYVNWIDSILTKRMLVQYDLNVDDSYYGHDPVEIVNDWVTIAEDGYLTLRFRTRYGGNTSHLVNLLMSQDPEKPYEVEFRHNAFGDDAGGRWADGLVAFKLDSLPDTNGQTVKLKLKWESFSGEKSTEFDYCTREATPAGASIALERGAMALE